jgi:hypothetical protein
MEFSHLPVGIILLVMPAISTMITRQNYQPNAAVAMEFKVRTQYQLIRPNSLVTIARPVIALVVGPL